MTDGRSGSASEERAPDGTRHATEVVTGVGTIRVVEEFRTPRLTRSGWSAVDEYLLDEALERLSTTASNVIVVNDRCGGISVALAAAGHSVVSISELSSQRARIAATATLNQASVQDLAIGGWEDSGAISGRVDLVLMVIPEGLGQLRRQLSSVARLLSGRNATDTPVIGGAMTRDVHRSTSRAFESSIGPTATSLARRRARLVRAEFAPKVAAAVTAVVEQRIAVHLPSAGSGSRTATLIAVPGTFGDRRLDEGASLMVSALADGAEGGRGASAGWGRVVDLGSGTGVLGLAAIGLGAERVAFIDDADSAVASTRMTIEANEWARIAAVTHVLGAYSLPAALDEIGWDAFDTLLCNPPFHHGRVQGPDVAEEMFAQAAARLAPDGTAWVVGNRHLGYHRTLRRWFGEVEVAASNPRFVVLRAAGQKRVRGG